MEDDKAKDASPDTDHARGWADRPRFVRGFVGALGVLGLISVAAGVFPALRNPHPHFPGVEFPGFFAVWGFAAFMFIVLAGQHLRKFVGRDEKYYDDRE